MNFCVPLTQQNETIETIIAQNKPSSIKNLPVTVYNYLKTATANNLSLNIVLETIKKYLKTLTDGECTLVLHDAEVYPPQKLCQRIQINVLPANLNIFSLYLIKTTVMQNNTALALWEYYPINNIPSLVNQNEQNYFDFSPVQNPTFPKNSAPFMMPPGFMPEPNAVFNLNNLNMNPNMDMPPVYNAEPCFNNNKNQPMKPESTALFDMLNQRLVSNNTLLEKIVKILLDNLELPNQETPEEDKRVCIKPEYIDNFKSLSTPLDECKHYYHIPESLLKTLITNEKDIEKLEIYKGLPIDLSYDRMVDKYRHTSGSNPKLDTEAFFNTYNHKLTEIVLDQVVNKMLELTEVKDKK